VLFVGVAMLLTTVLIALLVGRYLMKMRYDDLVGVAPGATGNPAILVYSTKMAPTERPDIGYAWSSRPVWRFLSALYSSLS
jgi:putative transport protein